MTILSRKFWYAREREGFFFLVLAMCFKGVKEVAISKAPGAIGRYLAHFCHSRLWHIHTCLNASPCPFQYLVAAEAVKPGITPD